MLCKFAIIENTPFLCLSSLKRSQFSDTKGEYSNQFTFQDGNCYNSIRGLYINICLYVI